jgi:lipopolysaccharide export system protein LptA
LTPAFERVVVGVIAVAFSAASAAYSQSLMPGGDNPLNLTAESLVWHRDDNKMVATGNARIIRSGVELRANILTAHSRKSKAGDGDQFYRFDAEGNVQIISKNERIFGDRGEYKIDDQNFVIVGNNLRIESNQGLITARDQLEYWEAKQQFVARGEATIVKEDKRLRADILLALLGTDAKGKQEIQQINVWGNVLISTASEIVQAEKGVYNVQTGIVRLQQNVKITRGKNQLNGNEGEVNLNTGISRLIGGKRRVRVLIPPQSKKRQ